MNKLLTLFGGLFLANASYAGDPIEMTTSTDDGTQYYVLPDTRTSNGVWVHFKNPKLKKSYGTLTSDALLEFNCQYRSFLKGWVRVIDLNGQILLNEKVNESVAPVVPDEIIEQLFNFACVKKQLN